MVTSGSARRSMSGSEYVFAETVPVDLVDARCRRVDGREVVAVPLDGQVERRSARVARRGARGQLERLARVDLHVGERVDARVHHAAELRGDPRVPRGQRRCSPSRSLRTGTCPARPRACLGCRRRRLERDEVGSSLPCSELVGAVDVAQHVGGATVVVPHRDARRVRHAEGAKATSRWFVYCVRSAESKTWMRLPGRLSVATRPNASVGVRKISGEPNFCEPSVG